MKDENKEVAGTCIKSLNLLLVCCCFLASFSELQTIIVVTRSKLNIKNGK